MTLKKAIATSTDESDEHTSPRKIRMQKKIRVLRDSCKKSKKTIKRLKSKLYRKQKKCETLESVINNLQDKNLLTEDQILAMFGSTGPSKALLSYQLQAIKKGRKPKQYSPELRVFAMNLHFYSPKAYEYVRSSLGKCLPHSRTISLWYRSINGTPGFTTESFETLKMAVGVSTQKKESLYVTIVFDEMAIRQKIERNENQTYGLVNI